MPGVCELGCQKTDEQEKRPRHFPKIFNFTCTGALQKRSEKSKKVVRLKGLYAILTKGDTLWRSDKEQRKGGLGF